MQQCVFEFKIRHKSTMATIHCARTIEPNASRLKTRLWLAAFDCLIVNCRLPLGGSQRQGLAARVRRARAMLLLIAVFKCHAYAPSKGS